MSRTRYVLMLVCLVLITSLAGCGWWKGLGRSGKGDAFDIPAQVLANEAEQALKEGNYDEASDLFQQLKDRYPYTRYSLLADLRVGDAYAKAKRYDEAALAYEDFVRLHPKNEAVPYAIYHMAMVHHEQMPTPDRDPASSRKAVDAFQRLVREYPDTEYGQKAFPRLREALERLAGHELSVGKYYFRTKQYEAAIGRFKRVLTQYPDVGLHNEAIELIRQSQEILDKLTPEERARRQEERRDLLVSPPNVETPSVLFGNERRGGPF